MKRLCKDSMNTKITVDTVLITQSNSFYWLFLWVYHSCFSNWDVIVSYEAKNPFWKRQILIYSQEEYMRNVRKVIHEIKIKNIDIQYTELPKNYLCHDFIWFYLSKNNIMKWFDSWDLKKNAYKWVRKFVKISIIFVKVIIIIYIFLMLNILNLKSVDIIDEQDRVKNYLYNMKSDIKKDIKDK